MRRSSCAMGSSPPHLTNSSSRHAHITGRRSLKSVLISDLLHNFHTKFIEFPSDNSLVSKSVSWRSIMTGQMIELG
jgi:hypothetical protein